MKTLEEMNQLKINRHFARDKAIQRIKEFKKLKATFCEAEARYDDAIREYNRLDREYAFALEEEKRMKLKKSNLLKPYNTAKRTATKALKALESLPEEIRKKIIIDAQNGLF